MQIAAGMRALLAPCLQPSMVALGRPDYEALVAARSLQRSLPLPVVERILCCMCECENHNCP